METNVKQIIVKVIPSKVANEFVKKWHYSGKVVGNSQLHFGAFLNGNLHGVMSFGPSMDKNKVIKLVANTGWNDFLELNRMAFDPYLPRNSESRCISIALRMIHKKAPHIKWIISFADGTQCGDGTIYRASNFKLCGINKNKTIIEMPNGDKIAGLSLDLQSQPLKQKYDAMCGLDVKGHYTRNDYIRGGAKILNGFMLRYIYIYICKKIGKICKFQLSHLQKSTSLVLECIKDKMFQENQGIKKPRIKFLGLCS